MIIDGALRMKFDLCLLCEGELCAAAAVPKQAELL
jgi:hypothetical protein